MSYQVKFHIARMTLWIGLGISVACLYRMYSIGLSDAQAAKGWFWSTLVAVGFSICTAVVYYYYRVKRQEVKSMEQVRIETLTAVVKKDDKERR
jgi:hypothetical protein